jgi:transcriptional regulator with XRE-family HTH domain
VRKRITEEVVRRRLAANVRAYRERAELTLKAASERAEMNLTHWQKVEAGAVNATLNTLTRVADALDVDPADLLAEPAKVRGTAR